MSTVLASWTVNGTQYKAELSNGEPLFEWQEPFAIVLSSTGQIHNIYRGAFTIRGNYVFCFFACTEPATVSTYYMDGSTWVKLSLKYTLSTQASNGLYYFKNNMSWAYQYSTYYLTYNSLDSNVNRYSNFNHLGELFYINSQANTEAYQAYIETEVEPLYNWQSVPSISGKNGILQNLVQIKEEAINDGEPVSEATVLSFDSLGNINIPSVIDEQMPVDPSDVTSVTATYLIPALENGTYEGIKLLVKKGSIPTSEEDADKVVNLDEPTSILRIDSKSVGNLDEDSHYYFVVKLVDEIGTEATSDPKDIWTSHNEGWSFDYTGQIQTFVAPKTGVYQLETWGAQGGDATDGTLTARGGYGAYAVGEVFLNQGDTLYINVGGQNGYGGGGK